MTTALKLEFGRAEPLPGRPADTVEVARVAVERPRGEIRVGLAGLGFMGMKHLEAYRSVRGARVTAIADAEMRAMTEGGLARGNLARAEPIVGSLSDVVLYVDPIKMAVSGDVDVVDVCTPTYEHRPVVNAALCVGRHVVCEKPLAVNIVEGRRIMRRVGGSKGFLMVAHCMRFWPEYVFAKEAVDDRRFGKVLSASFRRFSPRPDWSWRGWLLDESRSGGAALDLHVHDVDAIQWMMGRPTAVTARLAPLDSDKGGRLSYISTIYHYPGGPAILAEGGWLAGGRPFEMSFVISFERGVLDYDSRRKPTLLAFTGPGEPWTPDLPRRDAYEAELDYFMGCVREGKRPSVVTAAEAYAAVKIAWSEVKSAQTSRRVEIAPKPKGDREDGGEEDFAAEPDDD